MMTGGETPVDAQRPPRLWACFGILGAIWVLLLAGTYAQRHLDLAALGGSWIVQGVAVVLLAGAGALLWEFRRWVMRTFTSVPFSVAMIAVLLLWTVVGTVILQQAAPQAYVARHGEALGAVILSLGLDDLFHTTWFTGLLALAAVCLVLTPIEKRAWRPQMWGHLLCHLGFVTVLAGGWVGSRYGFKGVIDLHEGEIVHEAQVTGKGGVPGASRPLGFSLKLEKFAVEHYTPEAKFYVYEREGDGYRPVRAFTLAEAGTKRAIGSTGAAFRLAKAYPDFYLKPDVRDVAAGQGGPVLLVDFKQGDWSSRAALMAGAAGRDATMLSPEGPPARFVWASPPDAEIARLAAASPEGHVISLSGAAGTDAEEVTVEVGTPAVLPKGGYEVKVLEYLPDFSYDTKAKRATTRSLQPNNPAVQVQIRELKTQEVKSVWLYAKMPDFGHDDAAAHGPRFVYRLRPGHSPAPREMLIVGEACQLWRLERGQVVQRLPLEQWQAACAGLPVVGMRIHDSALIEPVPTTRSETWRNPAADIVLEEGGASRDIRMTAEHAQPVALADGKTFLSFELRTDEPKTFRSHLSVVEDGRTIVEKTIVVNDPLSYQGYMFYQSNFRKDDPTYSGIQVVRDPGLGIVFVGFVMLSLGVIFIYYIRPRLIAGAPHGS